MIPKLHTAFMALLLGTAAMPAQAQVKIGDNPATLTPSAMLEVNSTTQGLLLPRLTFTQMLAIASPVAGLIVYCSDCTPSGLQVHDGSGWRTPIGAASTTSNYVTTIAGNGVAGFVNDTGTAAQFSSPAGVAVDAAGNVYIADAGNNRIRKMTPGGVVSTFAGTGTAGSANGAGNVAQFSSPGGVAVDAAGNVYVADNNNHSIRKITSGGVVSTLAGSSPYGYANGPGSTAKFYYPSGVAVDAGGNVYVADQYNHSIRKITSAGVVTTLAGTGTAGTGNGAGNASQFYYPIGVAVDAGGNVYVSEQYGHKVRKVTSGGTVSDFAGSGTAGYADGTGVTAQFNYPYGVAVDALGNVYVADQYNERIRKVTPGGVVTTLAGSGAQAYNDGKGTAAGFNNPAGIAVDAAGNKYVADQSGHTIRKITP